MNAGKAAAIFILVALGVMTWYVIAYFKHLADSDRALPEGEPNAVEEVRPEESDPDEDDTGGLPLPH